MATVRLTCNLRYLYLRRCFLGSRLETRVRIEIRVFDLRWVDGVLLYIPSYASVSYTAN